MTGEAMEKHIEKKYERVVQNLHLDNNESLESRDGRARQDGWARRPPSKWNFGELKAGYSADNG